jgi:hypothetical protein
MPNIPEMPQPAQEGGDIEQMLAQLSPEELQQLAAQLGSEMQDPSASAGGDEVSELANAIEQHLAQNPEAAVAGAEPEKMAALRTVKSAGYIEGFIHQAVMGGANLKQAVDMYDNALTSTIFNLKQAALKGDQHKLDLNNNGKIDSSDLKNIRHEKSETPTQEKKEHMNNDMEEVKEAAYYEGVFERAAEYGFSKQATVELLHKIASFEEQALSLGDGGGVEPGFGLGNVTSLPGSDFEDTMRGFQRAGKEMADAKTFDRIPHEMFGGTPNVRLDNIATPEYLRDQVLGEKQLPSHFNLNNPIGNQSLMEKIQKFIGQHKSGLGMGALGLGAAGLGAGAYALANRKSNKEKKGSLEDEIALSLGDGGGAEPGFGLGNVTSLPGSDFEDTMRGFSRAGKEMADAKTFDRIPHEMFGGTPDVRLDNPVTPEYLRDQVLGEKQLPSHFNLNDPDPNASLMEKIKNFMKAHKSGLGMGAAGLGAAGLGAGGYALANRKKKNH